MIDSSADAPPPSPITPREILVVAATLLLTLLAWHDSALWGGQVFCGGDLVNYEIPLREVWRHGPLLRHWNEYSFAGAPFLANPQSAVFYAPYWLTWALPLRVELLTTWQTLAHLAWAGLGVWAFLRRPFGLRPALAAAVVWMTCGYQVGRIGAGILPFTVALSWMPWIWLLVERLGRPGSRAWAWLGLAAAAQFLVGATQVVHITACGAAVWLALRIAWPGTPRIDRFHMVLQAALAAVVALLIIAPQLIASLSLAREALGRGDGSDWAYLTNDSLPPRLLWTMLFPELFDAGTAEGTFWGSPVGYHETTAYVGVATLMLAAFGVVRAVTTWRALGNERRRWLVSLGVFGVLGLALALGRSSPVFAAAYAIIPGFDSFRVPARWIVGLVLAVIVMAAWGLSELIQLAATSTDDEYGDGAAARTPLLQWSAIAGGLVLAIIAVRLVLNPLLDWFGIDHFAPGGEELMATMRGRAAASVGFALGIAVVAGALGALTLVRRVPPAWGLALLMVVGTGDLLRFWQPWREPIPDTFAPWELGSEAPHHTIAGSAFRDWFYPETELVKTLHALKPGRVLMMDDVMDYRFDQYTRELHAQRPAMQGLEMLRGYEPLQRTGIARDVARISGIEPVTATTMGSFLRVPMIVDRAPLDAYNVTHVMTFARTLNPDYGEELEKVGLKLVHTTPFGLDVWENPQARGWAWLGRSRTAWLDDPPTVDGASEIERSPDRWSARVTVGNDDAVLHWSHSGALADWIITADAESNEPNTVTRRVSVGRSIDVPANSVWRIESEARTSGMESWRLALSALSALLALGFGLWPTARARDEKDSRN